MSSSSATISPVFIKSSVGAVAAAVLDRFIIGEQDMAQNAYFGVSVGLGLGVGSYISSLTPAFLPDSPGLYTGQGVMDRAFELLGGTASSYIVSKYMTKNETGSITSKLLVIVGSDVIAELIKDYITTQPVQYLA